MHNRQGTSRLAARIEHCCLISRGDAGQAGQTGISVTEGELADRQETIGFDNRTRGEKLVAPLGN